MPHNPLYIFFSYAHEDEELMDHVRRQLIVYERKGEIIKWHDREIRPGSDWKGKIDHHLSIAEIILLFMSPHFIESRYCYDVEGQAALKRHESGSAVILPVILRPCPWEDTPFGSIQALPKDGRPISRWDDIDEGCLEVARGVMGVVDGILSEHHQHADAGVDVQVKKSSAHSSYCSRCGAVPGESTKCPNYNSHDFVRNTGEVYCSRCGAVPGEPTKCSYYYSHDFVRKTGDVYCSRCGAVPGEPTKCTYYYSHDFVR